MAIDPISAGLGVVSIAGQVFSAIQGGKAMKASQNLLNKQAEENRAFYDTNVNRDFMETNIAKGITERLRKQYEEQAKRAENTAAITGGTKEAEIAEKSQAQQAYGQAMSSIAQQATGYQQAQEGMYRQEKARLTDQQMALNQQKAESAANLAQGAQQTLSAAASLTGFEDLSNAYKNPGRVVLSGENLASKTVAKLAGNTAYDKIAKPTLLSNILNIPK